MKEALIQTIALKPTMQSVKSARDFAAGLLDHHDVEMREAAVLLVSELVTNAVQHGGPHSCTATVALEVDACSDHILVKVTDSGRGEPHPSDGAVDKRSGRGLLLVEALASHWGFDRLPVGKTVWFDIFTLTDAGGDADA